MVQGRGLDTDQSLRPGARRDLSQSKGREAQGIVAPGEETRALQAELVAKADGLEDDPREVAINRVYDKDKIYAGPYKENAPDLIVGYNAGYRASWESVTGKVTGAVFEDNTKAWSGDHCIDPRRVPGVFFFERQGLLPGRRPSWTSPRPC